MRRWASDILSLPPKVPGRRDEGDCDIYTDASGTGWGAVLVDGQAVTVVGGRWTRDKKTISAYEVEAVTEAMKALRQKLAGRRPNLFIDNVPAKYAIRRGYSASFAVNHETARLDGALHMAGVEFAAVQYVRSNENPSDPESRRGGPAPAVAQPRAVELRGGWGPGVRPGSREVLRLVTEASAPSRRAEVRAIDTALRHERSDGLL
jgi:ribonuclease HI